MALLASELESVSSRREAFLALKAGFEGARERVGFEDVLASGISSLDRVLGGGFPRGGLVVLEGRAGRWSVAARLIALVTQRGLAAIVDDGGLYPPGLVRAGVRLDRVLVVPARTPLGAARAIDLLIRSRACRLVLLTAPDLRAAVWMRLAGLAHRAGVLAIAIAERAAEPLAAAAAVRLDCNRERLIVRGTHGLWSTFAGYDVRADVRKHRRVASNAHACIRVVEPLDGAPVRERAVAPSRYEQRQRRDDARVALR